MFQKGELQRSGRKVRNSIICLVSVRESGVVGPAMIWTFSIDWISSISYCFVNNFSNVGKYVASIPV
jgi:hypothetical protein